MKARKFMSTIMAVAIAAGSIFIPAPTVQAKEIEQVELQTQWTLEKGYEFIEYLEGILAIAGVESPRAMAAISDTSNTETVNLKVVDEDGNGIAAKVKFYPIKNNQDINTYNKTNNAIDGIRHQTDLTGVLSKFEKTTIPDKNNPETISPEGDWVTGVQIPYAKNIFNKPVAQRYMVEISKGSEYEIIRTEVTVTPNQTSDMGTITLKRIVDMSEEGWYAGDIHHHSIYSSPMVSEDGSIKPSENKDTVDQNGTDASYDTVEEVLISMQAGGMSFGALSEHHNVINHAMWDAMKDNKFLTIVGKEISTGAGHVQSLGTSENIKFRIPGQHIDVERTDEYMKSEFINVINQVKAAGGLVQINHPRDLSSSTAFPLEYTDIIDQFESVEVWNGANTILKGSINHEAFKLWVGLLNEGIFIPATTGSDTHNIHEDDYSGLINTLMELVDAIRLVQGILPADLKEVVSTILSIYDMIMPKVEPWVEENLGSGGIKTYVYLGEGTTPTTENVLDAVRSGHAVMSSGPVLNATVIDDVNGQGKFAGETARVDKNAVNIQTEVITNRPIENIYIMAQGKIIETVEVEQVAKNAQGGYTYQVDIKDLDVEGKVGSDVTWLSVIAASDSSNIAITNPIFIREQESLGLSALEVTPGVLSPDFSTETTEYSVKVKNATESISLTATTLGEEVNMTVNGEAVENKETYTMPIQVGDNEVVVSVTDYTGANKDYTITINRAEPSLQEEGTLIVGSQEITQGETFTLPVQLEDVSRLGRLYAEIEYDANLLTFEKMTFDGFTLHAAQTDTPGKIVFDAIQEQGIDTLYGTDVAYITFTANEEVSGVQANITVTQLAANGIDIDTPDIQFIAQDSTVKIGERKLGDLNYDGKVNSEDSHLLMQHLVNSRTLTEEQVKYADINKDALIDTADALAMVLKEQTR